MNTNGAAILTNPQPGSHIVYPYTDENLVSQAVCLYASGGLRKNEGVVLIMSRGHCEPIMDCLKAEGFDVDKRQRSGQLACVVAEELLPRLLVDGMPDTTRFKALIGPIIGRARASMSNGHQAHVRVFGEMVSLLLENNLPAATLLEEMWNKAIDAFSISLMCTYTLCGTSHEALPESLVALHSHNLA
jgi:MEDS: MEthanogen/methylotroph, DcmR Sensory domain